MLWSSKMGYFWSKMAFSAKPIDQIVFSLKLQFLQKNLKMTTFGKNVSNWLRLSTNALKWPFATKFSFKFYFIFLILIFQIKPGQISGQIPTKSCLKMNDGRLENNNGRVPYGAYNQANAKLVTADGDYPSNYEHYSNFEPKKPTGIAHARNPGILKGLFLFKLSFLRNFLKCQ